MFLRTQRYAMWLTRLIADESSGLCKWPRVGAVVTASSVPEPMRLRRRAQTIRRRPEPFRPRSYPPSVPVSDTLPLGASIVPSQGRCGRLIDRGKRSRDVRVVGPYRDGKLS